MRPPAPPCVLMILAVLVLASSMACGSAKPPAARPIASVASAQEKPVEDPPPAGPPVKVDCGDFTTCAIATGGSVRCWGNDKAGELGGGGGADRGKSVIVHGVEGATSIALASQFACALGSDKKVKCWGTGRGTCQRV